MPVLVGAKLALFFICTMQWGVFFGKMCNFSAFGMCITSFWRNLAPRYSLYI
jgi:hypothetical protein